MLYKDNFLISFNFLFTCLLVNAWYCKEKLDANQFWELKGWKCYMCQTFTSGFVCACKFFGW